MHQHALIFTNEGKAKKVKKKMKKGLSDSTSIGDEGVMSTASVGDSTQVETSPLKKKKKKKKKKKNNDQNESLNTDLMLTEQEKRLLAESGETIEVPTAKESKKNKKGKKRKNNDDDPDGESGLTDKERTDFDKDKKVEDEDDLKLSSREIRKADKEARAEEKRVRKEEKEKDPFNTAYRSRITPWWGKDQHPEVGEDWKPAKKVYKQPDERKARKLFRNLFGYPTR